MCLAIKIRVGAVRFSPRRMRKALGTGVVLDFFCTWGISSVLHAIPFYIVRETNEVFRTDSRTERRDFRLKIHRDTGGKYLVFLILNGNVISVFLHLEIVCAIWRATFFSCPSKAAGEGTAFTNGKKNTFFVCFQG